MSSFYCSSHHHHHLFTESLEFSRQPKENKTIGIGNKSINNSCIESSDARSFKLALNLRRMRVTFVVVVVGWRREKDSRTIQKREKRIAKDQGTTQGTNRQTVRQKDSVHVKEES